VSYGKKGDTDVRALTFSLLLRVFRSLKRQ
jgi:hypothetical protein